MKRIWTVLIAGLLVLSACTRPSDDNEVTLQLSLLGRYDSGIFDEGAAEIVAYDKATERLFVVNANDQQLDVLDISTPSSPALVATISVTDLNAAAGSPNSVAVRDGVVAVAAENEDKQAPGFVFFLDANGTKLAEVTAGALPDMVTFTPDGTTVLVANEGEPNDEYTVDPEGSISIIDLSGGAAELTQADVTTASFTSFNGQDLGDVRVFGPGASVAEDLEPEYIAVAADGATAYVTLQENNALAVVDIASSSVSAVLSLGFKDHSLPANRLDVSDRDDAISLNPQPVFGMYQPDAIAAFETGGATYLITANEGDARDYTFDDAEGEEQVAFSEEVRVEDLTLDPAAFPTAEALQAETALGRLRVTDQLGDTDGDGDFDRLYSYGARSFTIWSAEGELVYDSGDELEQIVASALPDDFNSTNDENDSFDSRSDDKGPEPEGVVTATIEDQVFAFIGLERVGGIAVFEVTEPSDPVFVQYINERDFSVAAELEDGGTNPAVGDLGPEGLLFIPAADSPSGEPLLVVGNEVSGTTSLFRIRVADKPAGL